MTDYHDAPVPPVVADMIDMAVYVMSGARYRALEGEPIAQAELVVLALCDTLCRPGRRGVYVPNADAVQAKLSRHLRDKRIRAEFNGRNHAKLAAKYDRTPRTVRRIIERGRP